MAEGSSTKLGNIAAIIAAAAEVLKALMPAMKKKKKAKPEAAPEPEPDEKETPAE